LKNRYFTASLWIAVATTLLNLCMVLLHREMSRRLGTGYADFVALMAIVNTVFIGLGGLNTWLTKIFTTDSTLQGNQAALTRLRSLTPWLLGLGAAVTLLVLAPGAWILAYLNMDSWMSYGLVALLLGAGVLVIFLRAYLQGIHAFILLGWSFITDGVIRVVLAVVFVSTGWGLAGALGAYLLAAMAILLLFWPWQRSMNEDQGLIPLEPDWGRDLLKDSLAMCGFSVLTFLDVIVAKHQLDAVDAGMYARAATVGKSLLYLTAFFQFVALPAMRASWSRGDDPRPVVLRFLSVMTLVDLSALAVVWAITPLVIKILLGENPEFQQLVTMVRWFSLSVIPLALFQIILMYGLAVHRRGAVLLLTALTAIYITALSVFGHDAWSLLKCLASISGIGLVAGSIWAFSGSPVKSPTLKASG
jgi:O-antigen/teichoic acid export membrane protein